MRIAGVAGAGLLVIGFMELERESEAMVMATGALISLGIALMLMVMAVRNRKSFSRLIRTDPADCSPGVRAFHACLRVVENDNSLKAAYFNPHALINLTRLHCRFQLDTAP